MADSKTFAPTGQTAGYVIEQYQLGTGVGRLSPVARGAMGRIWRLSVGDRDFAVKELFWGADEAAVLREAAFRDAAAGAGVASPVNLRTSDGHYVCQLPAELGGTAVRVFSWVEGRQVDPDDIGATQWIGNTLGVLHALRHPCDGLAPDPWYDQVPDSARWTELATRAAAARLSWAGALTERIPLFRSLTSRIARVDLTTLVYSHLDLQPQNVLIDSSGDYVLLDWEDAGPGMPDRGVAGLLCGWSLRAGAVDVGRARLILRAYGQAGGHAVVTGVESFSAVLAGYLNYVDAQASVSLDAGQSPDMRAHAERELEGSLAEPPGLDVFHELVEIALGRGSADVRATNGAV